MPATRAPWVGLDLENNRYHVLCLLGEGGMASIFKAIDRQLNKEIVLKVPKPALLADEEFKHRFSREIRTLVQLKHPSVVSVYGFGRHDGVPFAVLEFLSGGTLADQPKPCQPKDLGGWLPDVAAALDHIHKAGYVHRDVKPGNILFDSAGRARLADFGIIKSINEKANQQTMALTESGVTVGTPEYMAPELAKGHSFDGKVDQYALAVTVYERLSGRRPIEGGTGPVILVKQIREKPKPLNEIAEVSAALAEAVGRALVKDPKNRYANCFEFARAVMNPSRVASGALTPTPSVKQAVTSRAPFAYEPKRSQSSWVLPAAIGGGVFALMVFSLLGILLLRKDAPATPNTIDKVVAEAPSEDRRITLSAPGSIRVFSGKTTKIPITFQRSIAWSGPVELRLAPGQDEAMSASPVTVAAGANTAILELRLKPGAKCSRARIAADAGGQVDETEIQLDVASPQFSIIPIRDMQLSPSQEVTVNVSITRDGWDDPIALVVEHSNEIETSPRALTFPAGSNSANLKIRALRTSKPIALKLIEATKTEEKAQFLVAVAEAGKAKAAVSTSSGAGVRFGLLPSDISNIVFHPKDGRTFVVWDQKNGSVWDATSKGKTANLQIGSLPMFGTFSPDGKRITTPTADQVYVHDVLGKEWLKGPTRRRLTFIGTYYESGPRGYEAFFWTPNGLLNSTISRIKDTEMKANAIKYSTFGSAVMLTETNGQVKMLKRKDITFASPRALDFGVSHDGRWVVIAAGGKLLVYDIDAANPAAPQWESDIPGITRVAISPDGKRAALGVGNELRLLDVKSMEK